MIWNESEKEVWKNLKEMKENTKRLNNLVAKDDIRIDLLKVKDLKTFFKKKKLPKIAEYKKRNIEKKKEELTSFTQKCNSNYFMINHTLYTNKTNTSNGFGEFPFNVRNHLERIKELVPDFYSKKLQKFNSLPLNYKKMKQGFLYIKDEKIENEDIFNRFYQPDIHLSNQCLQLIPTQYKTGNNFYIYERSNTIGPFKTKDYHLKESLMLKNHYFSGLPKSRLKYSDLSRKNKIKTSDNYDEGQVLYSVVNF